MKITLPIRSLVALERFVSKEEVRYYLNGVGIQKHPTQAGILLVATDGHRLGVWHETNCHIEGEMPNETIIVKLGKRELQHLNTRSDFCSRVRFAKIDTEEKTVLVCESQSANLDPSKQPEILPIIKMYDMLIDGTFPDWRRVVPDVKKLKPMNLPVGIGLSAKLLGDFAYIEQPNAYLNFFAGAEENNGPIVVMVSNVENFVGVLMPAKVMESAKAQIMFETVLPPFPTAKAA